MGIPVRFWICVTIFLTTYINYTMRANMSISIISMTGLKSKATPECLKKPGEEKTNKTTTPAPLPDHGPRYDWSEGLQANIIGIYFIGYTVTSLPAGIIAEWMGPHKVIFWTHAVSSILNVVCVYAPEWHVYVVMATRFFIGAAAGLVYPALQVIIARWAPPTEKGKFASALMGNTLGTCITWPVVGVITENRGWHWGFHFLSIQMAVYCIIILFIASDSPEKHRWISEDEVKFIAEAQGSSVNKKKVVPPYLAMFKSVPFWALCILHVGNLWGLYLQMTGVPKFMAQVIGYNLRESGTLAALPHLMRLFLGFGFGALGDYLKKREVNPKFTRKFFVLFSHIIPGVALMCISLIGCNSIPIISLLVISMAVNGAAVLTNLQNSQDLAPNFAGSIFGIISFAGGLAGIITPEITGALNRNIEKQTRAWGLNFIIGGSVYVGTGIIFILFGSVEQQPWNEKKVEAAAAE